MNKTDQNSVRSTEKNEQGIRIKYSTKTDRESVQNSGQRD